MKKELALMKKISFSVRVTLFSFYKRDLTWLQKQYLCVTNADMKVPNGWANALPAEPGILFLNKKFPKQKPQLPLPFGKPEKVNLSKQWI